MGFAHSVIDDTKKRRNKEMIERNEPPAIRLRRLEKLEITIRGPCGETPLADGTRVDLQETHCVNKKKKKNKAYINDRFIKREEGVRKRRRSRLFFIFRFYNVFRSPAS